MASVKIPEMKMSRAEAESVAKAYLDVAEFYPVLQQTAKAAAFTQLFSVLGVTYGMRLVAIRNNRLKKPQGERPNVVDIQGRPVP